jgi:hypothetical protein
VFHGDGEESPRCHAHIEDFGRRIVLCSDVEDISDGMDLSTDAFHHVVEGEGLLIRDMVCLMSLPFEELITGWVPPSLSNTYKLVSQNSRRDCFPLI